MLFYLCGYFCAFDLLSGAGGRVIHFGAPEQGLGQLGLWDGSP